MSLQNQKSFKMKTKTLQNLNEYEGKEFKKRRQCKVRY